MININPSNFHNYNSPHMLIPKQLTQNEQFFYLKLILKRTTEKPSHPINPN